MPEAAVVEAQPVAATPEVPGWISGLPADLKQNADLTAYKTVGDFAKDALSWKSKATDLETRMADYIPKLPDDASDEDRATYYTALGRPEKASEYEFDGEDKNAPEWTNFWKQALYDEGLTKAQAKAISGKFNKQIEAMVKAANDANAAELQAADQKLRQQWGDKYDTNVELAKRLAADKLGDEFDSRFNKLDANGKQLMIELTLKYAALTGEDKSPQGGHSAGKGEVKPADAWLAMYKTPKAGVASRK